MNTKDIIGPKWQPVTLSDLIYMAYDDRSELLSICWNEGEFRCNTIGIKNFSYKPINYNSPDLYRVEYSDDCGDSHIIVQMDQKIDNVGDGEWNYGLYKKTKDEEIKPTKQLAIGINFLNTHAKYEESHNIDNEHCIVDRSELEMIWDFFNDNPVLIKYIGKGRVRWSANTNEPF